ncbi:2Fe-2S iron-sulfur cluster-binding protein [Hahella aquimaris]|uniref:2Fe-2S iron-sulfur cluster-binding protein n=1 Tax=Hahella sp. HNIBRBA332 TaxID=3015983 RepID=UPI00273CDC6C|nr:2Fe-2S iron-sulfur cluster-binding protein [Hahella sp. HNIBRBA332]WLQ15531.1 2Fe-2S iron-sulfur cluster-binding protein [Hahella sp. HNIBRBA332]
MGTINVKDLQGAEVKIQAVEGYSLMELLRDNGFEMAAICGGACICGTCHVHVRGENARHLPEPAYDEAELLETKPDYIEGVSRLACQINYAEELNGLMLELTEDN